MQFDAVTGAELSETWFEDDVERLAIGAVVSASPPRELRFEWTEPNWPAGIVSRHFRTRKKSSVSSWWCDTNAPFTLTNMTSWPLTSTAVVNLAGKLAQFDEHWAPRTVAEYVGLVALPSTAPSPALSAQLADANR